LLTPATIIVEWRRQQRLACAPLFVDAHLEPLLVDREPKRMHWHPHGAAFRRRTQGAICLNFGYRELYPENISASITGIFMLHHYVTEVV
jgi:hypothetical protein